MSKCDTSHILRSLRPSNNRMMRLDTKLVLPAIPLTLLKLLLSNSLILLAPFHLVELDLLHPSQKMSDFNDLSMNLTTLNLVMITTTLPTIPIIIHRLACLETITEQNKFQHFLTALPLPTTWNTPLLIIILPLLHLEHILPRTREHRSEI